MILSLISIILGYVMGSVSSAVIVCRVFNLPDPRVQGSKNPGASNVLRIAGKRYAALVLVVDMLKGVIPVVIAKSFELSPAVVAFTVLAAVIGHIYPIFFNFKGGKGVATAIGALLAFHFLVGVMVAATWLIVANFLRYASLASLISITLAPLYTLLLVHQLSTFPPLLFMVILIIYKHKNNITRLMDGVEPKILFKHSVMEEIREATILPTEPAPTVKHPQKRVTPTTKTVDSKPAKAKSSVKEKTTKTKPIQAKVATAKPVKKTVKKKVAPKIKTEKS